MKRMESPAQEEVGAPGLSATYHYPNQKRMSLEQELKSKGKGWKCPFSECYKWPWDISCKCQAVWVCSRARTRCDAFLSHELLFLKYCACIMRFHGINKICVRQIYLYLQEVLSSFWILDHFWSSVAPFCSAIQGIQRALSHNESQVSIFFSSPLPHRQFLQSDMSSLKSDIVWLSVSR